METTKTSLLIWLCILSTFLFSCKKDDVYNASGIVVNNFDGKPMAGVRLVLSSQAKGGGILDASSGEPEEVLDEVTTGADGKFSLSGKTDRGSCNIYIYKENFSGKYNQYGTQYPWIDIKPGESQHEIKLFGSTYFQPSFNKISAAQKDSDKLNVYLFDNLSNSYFEATYFTLSGKGPFNKSFYQQIPGEKYQKYKLEYWEDNVQYTVIDSIFVPASATAFSPLITY
jgi:hypothetical protein